VEEEGSLTTEAAEQGTWLQLRGRSLSNWYWPTNHTKVGEASEKTPEKTHPMSEKHWGTESSCSW